MGAVAKRFFRRGTATAKRHSFFHGKLVSVGVDQFHFALHDVRTVLDCLDCYHVRTLTGLPRAAMSVATITSYLPLLNPSRASIRSRWVRLECKTATEWFPCFNLWAIRSAPCLVREKMSALSKLVRSSSAIRRSNFCSAATG